MEIQLTLNPREFEDLIYYLGRRTREIRETLEESLGELHVNKAINGRIYNKLESHYKRVTNHGFKHNFNHMYYLNEMYTAEGGNDHYRNAKVKLSNNKRDELEAGATAIKNAEEFIKNLEKAVKVAANAREEQRKKEWNELIEQYFKD